MDLKEIYENKTGKDPWFKCELTGTYGLTQNYVEWLEKQLNIGVVGSSLPNKEAFIPKLEATVEEKHKGCDELEKELLKLGGLYAYRIIYDLMKK